MNVDLGEFRSAFVAEAEEHLASAQSLLLATERLSREGKGAPRELRELMRLLHTVKGLAAMVGVEPIVTIAHKMETILRAAERAGATLGDRSVEVLLAGARALATRVRAVAEDRVVAPPSPDILSALDGLEAPTKVERPAESLPLDPGIMAKLSPSELEQLRSGARDGRRAVRLDFAPSTATAAAGISITTVRASVTAIAEIVKVVPLTMPAAESGPGGLVFALLLLSEANDEAIALAAGLPDAPISLLLATADPLPVPESVFPQLGEEDEGELFATGGRNVLRVEVARVDDAIEMLGALVVTRSRMAHALDQLEVSGADTRELRGVLADNARQLRDLRAAILRVRMIPLAEVLRRLPLVVRGLGRGSGKKVRTVIDVGDAELDKTVAERLFPALLHIARNAVDHGIELPEARLAAGKPEVATVTIRAVARDRAVEVRLSDDGGGIDTAAVARRAGVPVPATANGLLELLCRPGLSTRAQADLTSGRGVGMDVVRKVVVHRLGGEISLETQRGVGTTFVLRVPLTVAIVDAFTVRCGAERYAVPVPIVDEIIELSADRLIAGPRGNDRGTRGGSPRLLSRRGTTIAVFDLARALSENAVLEAVPPHALVVRRSHDDIVAYAVDRVLGQQEIVVRPLVDPLVASPAISGSTDLGDGRATIVLDLLALSTLIEGHDREVMA